jgi:hypothetical protein
MNTNVREGTRDALFRASWPEVTEMEGPSPEATSVDPAATTIGARIYFVTV